MSAVAASSAALVSVCHSRTWSDTGPATIVRVMSAKQEEASSRGQRSKTTGSPNLIGPWPMSWPAAPCGPGATTKSSAVQPCSAKTRRIAALTRSTVSGSPSSQSTPSPFSACRSSETPAARPASAARWARRMPSSSAPALTRRRASNTA